MARQAEAANELGRVAAVFMLLLRHLEFRPFDFFSPV